MKTETVTTHYLELDDFIPFGKYKNKYTLDIIIMADMNYIKWFQTNVTNYKFSKEVLKAISDQETLNYAEWLKENIKYEPGSKSLDNERDIDMGGGSKDSENESGWSGSDSGWGFDN